MKRWTTIALALLFTVGLPLGTLAMEHQDGKMDGMSQGACRAGPCRAWKRAG